MNKLLFGISGLPIGSKIKNISYASGIEYVREIGLDAMELLFVRNVNVTDKNWQAILKAGQDYNVYLSAHGSHYINLNADDYRKQEQSIQRIIAAREGIAKVCGRSLVFHPGYYLKDSREETYKTILQNLQKLPGGGIAYRLETTGKSTQFGTLEELVSLCREISSCKLCVDFSHIHARLNGALKTFRDFYNILIYIFNNLGGAALEDMHIHMGGIKYGGKGEIKHLPLMESDFNFPACLKALKEFDVKGCVIAEGPLVEEDALLLKETYQNL